MALAAAASENKAGAGWQWRKAVNTGLAISGQCGHAMCGQLESQ